MNAVAEYAIVFVGKNFRHMKTPRMARKIADHYHLPIKEKTNETNKV